MDAIKSWQLKVSFDNKLKQDVSGRTNRLFSFHYVLSIWYKDHIENTKINSSYIAAYIFFLLSRHYYIAVA
jgi:hypothetical protein